MSFENFSRNIPLIISLAMFSMICTFYFTEVVHIPLQKIDTSSASNLHQIIIENYDIKVKLDFDTHIIEGEVILNLKAVSNEVSLLILDARDLTIKEVESEDGKSLKYIYSKWLGIIEKDNDVLVIYLPKKVSIGEKINIKIKYRTSSSSSAVSWLTPSQTSGKLPFMYTQCESIHCRSIVPSMDSPAIRSTFNISITVPKALAAYASGLKGEITNHADSVTYSFHQRIPVPIYLLAFAAGSIEYRRVGKRTGVLAEPEMIEKCVKELAELEEYLITLEKLFDPYIWGEYNIIVLPRSFPYGGMENPYLTFAGQTIIIGDKSQVNVAIHEIVHSWFGNRVTNRNWENFWLNEGTTVFAERQASKSYFGYDKYMDNSLVGYYALAEYINLFGENDSHTILNPNLERADPEDYMTLIYYEKGYQFHSYLSQLTGEENYLSFLRSYISAFSLKTVDSEEFKIMFLNFIDQKLTNSSNIKQLIQWEKWLHSPGFPPNKVDFTTSKSLQSISLAHEYVKLNGGHPLNASVYKTFSIELKNVFVLELAQAKPSSNVIIAVDQDLSITNEENDPWLLSRWFTMAIKAGVKEQIYEKAKDYACSVGRMRLISPIYTAWASVDKNLARKYFNQCNSFYHPIALELIGKILK